MFVSVSPAGVSAPRRSRVGLVHHGGLCDTQLGVLGMFFGFVNYRTQQVSDSGADSHACDNRQPAGPLFCWVGGDRHGVVQPPRQWRSAHGGVLTATERYGLGSLLLPKAPSRTCFHSPAEDCAINPFVLRGLKVDSVLCNCAQVPRICDAAWCIVGAQRD